MPAKKSLPVISPVKSWSFSRWNLYEQCPLKFKLATIQKIKELPSPAMERGAAIGKLAEEYIKGVTEKGVKVSVKVPPELLKFEALFKDMRKRWAKKNHGMTVESTWAFKKNWDITTWDDWNGCYLRIKVDCAHPEDKETLVVTDFKTGKYRPDTTEQYLFQLELYAAGALVMHPELKTVKVRLAFLDAGVFHPAEDEQQIIYTRKDLPGLQKLWAKRTVALFSDSIWAPRPNAFCRWCHYRKDNKANGGGQCPI